MDTWGVQQTKIGKWSDESSYMTPELIRKSKLLQNMLSSNDNLWSDARVVFYIEGQ